MKFKEGEMVRIIDVDDRMYDKVGVIISVEEEEKYAEKLKHYQVVQAIEKTMHENAIDAYIKGIENPKFPPVPQKRAEVEKVDVGEEKMAQLKRPKIPLLEIDKRLCTFDQVELGLSEKAARDEAKRCLRCDLS